VNLLNPDTWDLVAAELVAKHPHVYDLDDRSHATDVAQIVCQIVARLQRNGAPR
jgi:hypothetical protein